MTYRSCICCAQDEGNRDENSQHRHHHHQLLQVWHWSEFCCFYKQAKSYLFFKVRQSHIVKVHSPCINLLTGQHMCSCVKLSWKIEWRVEFIRSFCNLNNTHLSITKTYLWMVKTFVPSCRIIPQRFWRNDVNLPSAKMTSRQIYLFDSFLKVTFSTNSP